MSHRVHELIEKLQLTEHPEGGYYKEVYRSPDMLYSPRNGELRAAVTDIYFLLEKGQVSRFHKVAHDELWHFYEGAPLELIEVEAREYTISKTIIGDKDTMLYKQCVNGGNWQAAASTGAYSLVGCTVAPGFDFEDFEFLSEDHQLCTKVKKEHEELLRFL